MEEAWNICVMFGEGKRMYQAKTDNGFTALMAASENDHVPMVEVTLQEGKASTTKPGGTALMGVLRNGHLEVLLREGSQD